MLQYTTSLFLFFLLLLLQVVIVELQRDEEDKPAIVQGLEDRRGCRVLVLGKQGLQSIKHHPTMAVTQLQRGQNSTFYNTRIN